MKYQNLDEEESKLFDLIIGDLHRLLAMNEISAQNIPDLLSELQSDEVKAYVRGLSIGSKPESVLREAFFAGRSLLSKYLGGTLSPEVHLKSGFVDYVLNVNDKSILIELKSLFEAEFESDGTPRLRRLVQRAVSIENHKEQVLKYLQEVREFAILTDLKNWFFFSRSAMIDSFEPFDTRDFFHLIEDFERTGNFWNFTTKLESLSVAKTLDKKFFSSLKAWVQKLSQVKFLINDETKIESIIHLLNKFIFIQTLDDYFVIDSRWIKATWEETERKWRAKGKYRVLKEYLEETDKWFYEYYDTELFKGNFMKEIATDEKNLEMFYNNLQVILGVSNWQESFKGVAGITQYNFRLIDEDIFGKAYETYLADVRHDEAIYYTPTYITNHIVDLSVGYIFDKLLTQIRTALETEDYDKAQDLMDYFISVHILDPSCGSGSFLIKALRNIMKKYRELNDIFAEFSAKYDNYNGSLVRTQEVETKARSIRLLRKIVRADNERELISRLLVRHIYGIDLDKKALEVAKVNIWLEAIKLAPQEFRVDNLPRETNHVLPNLEINLVNGDSVIGLPDDFVAKFMVSNASNEIKELSSLRNSYLQDPTHPELIEKIALIKDNIRKRLDEEFTKYLKGISIQEDLQKETVPLYWPLEFWFTFFDGENTLLAEDKRWFDVVIGNPPYKDAETMTNKFPYGREFLRNSYESASGNWDMFCVFTEKGVRRTTKGGVFGYIIPNKFLVADYADGIRKFLKNFSIKSIRDYSKVKVFDAAVYPIVLIVMNKDPSDDQKVNFEILEQEDKIIPQITYSNEVSLNDIYSAPGNIWSTALDPTYKVFKKIVSASFPVGQEFNVYGAATVAEAYEISKKLYENQRELNSDELKLVNTGTIDKYVSLWGYKRTRYLGKDYERPVIRESDLSEISTTRLSQAKNEKIIVANMAVELEAVYDKGEYSAGKSTTVITRKKENQDLVSFSGIINSLMNTFVLRIMYSDLSLQGGSINLGPDQVGKLAIPIAYLNSDSVKHELRELVAEIMSQKSIEIKLMQQWINWSKVLKNHEESLLNIIKADIARVQDGDFGKSWISQVSRFPSDKDQFFKERYESFILSGNQLNNNITITGIRKDGSENMIYSINFTDDDLMTHTYFALKSLLNSKLRVNNLSDILNKTTIPVIQPNINQRSVNILRRIKEEPNITYRNIIELDKETLVLEAEVDALVFKLTNLTKDEAKSIMNKLNKNQSYEQKVLSYF